MILCASLTGNESWIAQVVFVIAKMCEHSLSEYCSLVSFSKYSAVHCTHPFAMILGDKNDERAGGTEQ